MNTLKNYVRNTLQPPNEAISLINVVADIMILIIIDCICILYFHWYHKNKWYIGVRYGTKRYGNFVYEDLL